jgi:hypothetical protein
MQMSVYNGNELILTNVNTISELILYPARIS